MLKTKFKATYDIRYASSFVYITLLQAAEQE